jgi:starch-binding outer membrane protein, SusD/RagB family
MKIKYLVLPTALAVALGGCGDLLTETPRDFITADMYYSTEADIEGAAAAMYPIYQDWNMFKVQHWWTFELAADHGNYHPDEPNAETQAPQYLNWSPATREPVQLWFLHYAAIRLNNTVIEFAPNVDFREPARQRALIAEAQFNRAFNYFWLARGFGGVPLVLSLNDPVDLPRNTEAEVFEQIIADLEEAIPHLPLTRNQGTERGRASRYAAMALLADVYRWRANTNLANTASADWQKVIELSELIMNSGQYALLPNYLSALLPQANTRSEEIFAIQSTPGIGWNVSLFGAHFGARNFGDSEGGGWAVSSAAVPFWRSWDRDDYRFEVTYMTEDCPASAKSAQPGVEGGWICAPGTVEHLTPVDWEGRLSHEPMGFPHVRKYRETDFRRDFWGNGDVNMPMYRLADIVLIYAEALNAVGRDADALVQVNRIRARARQGTGNESRAVPADLHGLGGLALKDAIYRERELELAYEMKRWFDLVQRGPAFFVQQLTTNDPTSNRLGLVTPDRMRLPIPAGELVKNVNLVQNPGY